MDNAEKETLDDTINRIGAIYEETKTYSHSKEGDRSFELLQCIHKLVCLRDGIECEPLTAGRNHMH